MRRADRRRPRAERLAHRRQRHGQSAALPGRRTGRVALYRFSPNDYQELAAVFNGPHPETGQELSVVDEAPEGVPPNDLPAQPSVFAPDHAPEEIAEIAKKLRKSAGSPKSRPASSRPRSRSRGRSRFAERAGQLSPPASGPLVV